MKSKDQATFDGRTFNEEDLILNKHLAAALAQDCWNVITSKTFRQSWDMEGIRIKLDQWQIVS
jgi:hypothetical protein